MSVIPSYIQVLTVSHGVTKNGCLLTIFIHSIGLSPWHRMNFWLREGFLPSALKGSGYMSTLTSSTPQWEQIYRVKHVVLKTQYLHYAHFWEIPLQTNVPIGHWSILDAILDCILQFSFIQRNSRSHTPREPHDANKDNISEDSSEINFKSTLLIQAKMQI